MNGFRDRPEFKMGRAGELMVGRWLRERGWYVIPSYDYSGDDGEKAPKLHGIRNSYPVLDLDVCKSGERRWVEVKTKASAEWYRNEERYQHGIEHYADYLRVQEETGNKAWLAILETTDINTLAKRGEAGLLLMQSFAELGQPQVGTFAGKKMAYWDRRAFRRVHIFPEVGLAMQAAT